MTADRASQHVAVMLPPLKDIQVFCNANTGSELTGLIALYSSCRELSRARVCTQLSPPFHDAPRFVPVDHAQDKAKVQLKLGIIRIWHTIAYHAVRAIACTVHRDVHICVYTKQVTAVKKANSTF